MSPIVKKVIAGLAIKEAVERVQEYRRPKPSLLSRIFRPLAFLGLGGGLFYLYKSGKLGPLIEQAKGLTGSGADSGAGTFSAPATTNGATAVGAASTSSTL